MFKMLASKFSRKRKILNELSKKRSLPLGVKEFHAWSDIIISGALIGADSESQKFALADMILHLNPTEDHKEDAYFIKVLRKTAVNQVADYMRKEIRDQAKARLHAEELAKAAKDHICDEVLEHTYVPPQVSELVITPCEVTPTPEEGKPLDGVLEK